jgi:hypothetical protein
MKAQQMSYKVSGASIGLIVIEVGKENYMYTWQAA